MLVMDSIPSHGLTADVTTYRCLIRMHILAKDINSALELKEAMVKDVRVNFSSTIFFHFIYFIHFIFVYFFNLVLLFDFRDRIVELLLHHAFSNSSTFHLQGMIPDAESYGWLIRSCGHRDMLVEGLKLLEETATMGTHHIFPLI